MDRVYTVVYATSVHADGFDTQHAN